MNNAASFRTAFSAKERGATLVKYIDEYIKGVAIFSFSELFSSFSFSELAGLRDAARDALKADPNNISLRQKWLFAESLYRDAVYAHRGYQWCKQVGMDSLYSEAYETAKIAFVAGAA